MPLLPADYLARPERDDLLLMLREDLVDALKEYNQLDLLVEVLQNALDAIDQHRYALICEAAGCEPQDHETVTAWNEAVLECIRHDYERYAECDTAVKKANLYHEFLDDKGRRQEWWQVLASHLGGDPEELSSATAAYSPEMQLTVRLGSSIWIEVEDNGVGMRDIPRCFHHKISDKRGSTKVNRRLGVRGSHGWGLTAVLAMSNRIEVISRALGEEPQAFAFSDYDSFCDGETEKPKNERISLGESSSTNLSRRLQEEEGSLGTHIRVRINSPDDADLLGNTLDSYEPEKFVNLLRLYTPIGQVNDLLLHPAYHTIRKDEIKVSLASVLPDRTDSTQVNFDVFRLSEHGTEIPSYDYYSFVNAGWPSNVSVHTIHRSHRGGNYHLSAAEVQSARSLVQPLEDRLRQNEVLPGYIDENERCVQRVPRGFYLALSGGMMSNDN